MWCYRTCIHLGWINWLISISVTSYIYHCVMSTFKFSSSFLEIYITIDSQHSVSWNIKMFCPCLTETLYSSINITPFAIHCHPSLCNHHRIFYFYKFQSFTFQYKWDHEIFVSLCQIEYVTISVTYSRLIHFVTDNRFSWGALWLNTTSL